MDTEPRTIEPNRAETDPFLDVHGLAERGLCSEATVYRMIAAGLLSDARVGPGRKHIRARGSWMDQAMEATGTPVEAK